MKPLDLLAPHPVLFAPMVGISHFAVRSALAEFLPSGARSLWPTEMLNSRRIPSQKENQCPEVNFSDKANGLCPQLLGNEERFIADSVVKLEEWGALAIDINMGCPVQKALSHNYGVSLMGDAAYAAEVTSMATRNTKLPVSVKLRAGFVQDRSFLLNFTRGLQDAGASWITLHPRTAEQKRRGAADWELIAYIKELLEIPVIGNGDVQCLADVKELFERTGCDRVMVGRALLAKPWLLSGLTEEPSQEAQLEAYRRFHLRAVELASQHYELPQALRKIRFLVFHSHVWLEFGHYLYSKVKQATTIEAVQKAFLEELKPQKILQKTDWRG